MYGTTTVALHGELLWPQKLHGIMLKVCDINQKQVGQLQIDHVIYFFTINIHFSISGW